MSKQQKKKLLKSLAKARAVKAAKLAAAKAGSTDHVLVGASAPSTPSTPTRLGDLPQQQPQKDSLEQEIFLLIGAYSVTIRRRLY